MRSSAHIPRGLVLLIPALIVGFSLFAAEAPAPSPSPSGAWNPAATRALLLGVLTWEDKSLATWPDKDRSDEVLATTLLSRGVPKDNLKFLKNEKATRSAALKALDGILGASKADETLLFYYAGHGGREGESTVFLPYDNLSGGTISTRELGERIARGFKGGLVILLADCCYSGGLMETADIVAKAGKKALVLASVVSSSSSTGAWTFTDSLVDLLGGRIAGDRAGKAISFGAAEDYVLECMKIADRQLACAYRAGGIAEDFILAKETPPLLPVRPVYREVFDGKGWFPARILQVKGTTFYVHFPGYGEDWDDWYGAASLRLPDFERFAVGDKVMVEWNGEWYRAKVLAAEGDFHFIRYDGYGSEWDEWVATPRIKAR